MTRVSSTILDTGGVGIPHVFVDIEIQGPATWLKAQGAEVTGPVKTFTNDVGVWSIDLLPQSAYTVTGTFYQVREWNIGTYDIVVPDGPDQVSASDCLVNPPPEISSWSPISTFDSLRDVDPANRQTGDTIVVGDDGLLEFVPRTTTVQIASKIVVPSANTSWTLDHNLGYDPAGVRLFDSTGEEFEADISYPIPGSRVLVSFPFGVSLSGTAYLS